MSLAAQPVRHPGCIFIIMDELHTCGQGLAQRSELPARLSAWAAAMAEVLDTHQQTLDLTDDNGKAELIAYQQLTSDYRRLTSELRATADRMRGYRDLPMARHDTQKMLAPEIRSAFANLVERERDLADLVKTLVEQDQAMLGGSKVPSARNAAGEQTLKRHDRARSVGAVAFGAFAVGASAIGAAAIGALAIGSLAIGALALKRGHVRTLRVDDLDVRRLHIGELLAPRSLDEGGSDSEMPR